MSPSLNESVCQLQKKRPLGHARLVDSRTKANSEESPKEKPEETSPKETSLVQIKKNERALTPRESGELIAEPPPESAAGLSAVVSSLDYTIAKSGLVRGTRALLRVNQDKGFDCPGCAWPDPDHRASFEFCENGARAVADEATHLRADPDFFAKWTIDELAERSDHWLNGRGRLTHPMIREEGSRHYRAIKWDEAFDLIAKELQALESPDEAIFYTSGRTSNEAAFLYQLFVRCLGTNNLPDCSNLCHESSGTALGESIGIGKGTVQLEDFDAADAIFVFGQNPGTNHPRMLSALESAKRKGATIVSVNPLREPGLLRFRHPQKVRGLVGSGTKLSDLYLQVRIGGDLAFVKGMMKAVLEAEGEHPGEVLDHKFIDEHTTGVEKLRAQIRELSWNEISKQCGLSEKDIRHAADIYMQSKGTIICWAMGITQHPHAVATIQEIVNLQLLLGNLGKKGAGLCPVRGHSNVQGDRTVGIVEKPKEAFSAALDKRFGIQSPRHHGVDAVQAVHAMHRGQGKVFFAMGGNFLSANADTRYTAEAMQKCRLTVHVSTKPNRSHLVGGKRALILPCLGRSERDRQKSGPQFVTVENSMGIVHRSQGRLSPASKHLLSEPEIVARLAAVTLSEKSPVDWMALIENYDRIRELIESVIPGFEDYNRRVRNKHGFLLPNGARDRAFNTASGKAEFHVHELPQLELKEGQLRMMTVRSHDQYNTTVYDLNDRYRGIFGLRRILLLNRKDMDTRNIRSGDKVTIRSHFRDEVREVQNFIALPYDLPLGSAASYFPEANPLVPIDSTAERSGTPTSKSIVITLHPATNES